VLGGGMAGLAAAHELAERGFRVTVHERKALGGKARSIPVPGTAANGRRALPGEHGFRFFPGFYHHVPDTMRRTPFAGNADGVWNNLVDATTGRSVRTEGRPDVAGFGGLSQPTAGVRSIEQRILAAVAQQGGIPQHEAAFFTNRLLVFLTSSDERRFGEWERTSWWDFVRAEAMSDDYKQIVAKGLTRLLVAAKETVASTRTIGNMAEAFLMTFQGRGNDGAPDRVLDAPTNEAWIDPWVQHLRSLGVAFHVGHTVEALELRRGRIAAARVRDRAGRRRLAEADWFVCAMPVERARRLWSPALLRADPALEGMRELRVDWMGGIQLYLRRRVELTHGHVSFVDSPWALTGLTQAQFWRGRFRRRYGDGEAVDCLSIDISDWDTPGILYGKPAKRCSPAEVKNEVWAQAKAHLEDTGEVVLPDDVLHSWFLDPAIAWDPARGRNANDEPLLVNTVGSWENRPTAGTAIPNLVLAGDYVQTDIDLATMEGANESAREAVNEILRRSGSRAEPARKFRLYDPPELDAAKREDAARYRAGLPNVHDQP
ncbi:MAG TPA: FAD-dependent oxidoreductase, partial [Solirubrobacteraceae bacterium]|nr:FAD-dependent oxidoreductase [Solirubrobacteraceae bacterium]